ncbi:Ionotropic receptor 131 [Frankliniella occidentalis]|nr:Ionotropic receptor 131 [Frankliniella occidentalis]
MRGFVLVALVLCPWACDAIPLVPAPPTDSQGMADLVASFLMGTTAAVRVYGRARGLGAFLKQLPAELPRTAASKWNGAFDSRLDTEVGVNRLLVIAEDSRAQLIATINAAAPSPSRVLLWTWAARPEDGLVLESSCLWILDRQVAQAVSVLNGPTFLFTVAAKVLNESLALSLNMTQIDRWSPRARRWQHRAAPFLKFCSTWSPHQSGTNLAIRQIYAVLPRQYSAYPESYIDFVTSLMNSLNQPVHLHWRYDVHGYKDVHARLLNCTLDAAITYDTSVMRFAPEIRYASQYLTTMQVIVPAGLHRVNLLQAVTAEFSAELWWATVVAVSVVTMATVLVTRVFVGQPWATALTVAPLLTLAPLLGQPSPIGTTHRPLAAVWLLMSVVIVAAYQGLLLRELTAPPGEIDSLEQLEDSGLDIRMSMNLYIVRQQIPSDLLRSRITYVLPEDVVSTVRTLAEKRNFALVLQRDTNMELILSPYLTSIPKKLHAFNIGFPFMVVQVWLTAGSPLEAPLQKALRLFQQHGLLLHMFRSTCTKLGINIGVDLDEQLVQPLSLRQLRPAFLLLACGLGISSLVFVSEIVYNKFRK